ncbi:tetratricopeptide repeat protein [bacterium]|nr:tetratricopeptide repeat protein [bacterium]
MSSSPKVFISFSSKDKPYVRKIFYRLKSQNIDIWDYSHRGEEIPLGGHIPTVLREQIDQSDFFITVLSKYSMDPEIGRYTTLEVEYVLSKGWQRQGRILPLLLLNHKPGKWADGYESLRDTMYLEVDTENPKCFEEAVAKIAKHLSVPYIPLFIAHSRLPFSGRFDEEIKGWNLPNAVYQELMLIIHDFSHHYAEYDYIAAEKHITYFLLYCGYNIPGLKPYYPLIVKGVCHLHLGEFAEAEQAFLDAVHHPLCDENSYGGLGQVYFRQKRYEEALKAFNQALKMCPPEHNLEIWFNILGALIQSGQEITDFSFLDAFDVSALSESERINYLNMKSIAFYKKKDYDKALNFLTAMRQQKTYNVTTVIYIHLVLKEMENQEDALAILEEESDHFTESLLDHYLALFYFYLGMDQKAIKVYEEKLLHYRPPSRQFTIEYARIMKYYDQLKMRRVCEEVLNRDYFPIPKTKEDFFYDGYANFLLENHERAKYDYERSEDFCDQYYNQLD